MSNSHPQKLPTGNIAESVWKGNIDMNVEEKQLENVRAHGAICKQLNALYERKNHDYGDSFHESWNDFGLPMAAIRLGDKYRRLKSFAMGKEMKVTDESVRDTLMDLANYAIMTVIEIDREFASTEGKPI